MKINLFPKDITPLSDTKTPTTENMRSSLVPHSQTRQIQSETDVFLPDSPTQLREQTLFEALGITSNPDSLAISQPATSSQNGQGSQTAPSPNHFPEKERVPTTEGFEGHLNQPSESSLDTVPIPQESLGDTENMDIDTTLSFEGLSKETLESIVMEPYIAPNQTSDG